MGHSWGRLAPLPPPAVGRQGLSIPSIILLRVDHARLTRHGQPAGRSWVWRACPTQRPTQHRSQRARAPQGHVASVAWADCCPWGQEAQVGMGGTGGAGARGMPGPQGCHAPVHEQLFGSLSPILKALTSPAVDRCIHFIQPSVPKKKNKKPAESCSRETSITVLQRGCRLGKAGPHNGALAPRPSKPGCPS